HQIVRFRLRHGYRASGHGSPWHLVDQALHRQRPPLPGAVPMKVSLSWLNEFVELPTFNSDEIRAVLTMLGHEVEGVELLAADWTDVIVGKVVDIAPHPDADRIRVCQVDTGDGPEQII